MFENVYLNRNIDEVDSPALMVYPSIIRKNIKAVLGIAGDNILRPPIKTAKSKEVTLSLIEAGITHFKCATIAGIEMLSMSGGQTYNRN